MKETGTRKEVLKKVAKKTKIGETFESLTTSNKKYASMAKRSESAQNSPWRLHVLNYGKKKKLSYSAALADPDCKKTYVKVVKTPKVKPATPSVGSTPAAPPEVL